MATKTKTFSMFGVDYRVKQFAAVQSLEIMANSKIVHPTENLRLTEVKVKGDWHSLDNKAAINEHVKDMFGILPSRMVLDALLKFVNEFSFGFAYGWKGVKIPRRFKNGDIKPQESMHVDPLIAHVLEGGQASLRELEEYYSLEDAFKMFDVMTAKGVNEALAQEAAMSKK